jgi:hypothetical protein
MMCKQNKFPLTADVMQEGNFQDAMRHVKSNVNAVSPK